MRVAGLELWGGVECTVNRVGDRYRDQMRLSGHHDRAEDLSRVAALGIRTLRFPVIWERVSPDRPDAHDWAWSDARLAECARLGIRPIVGLLHHGSGPRYTSLIDPDMPHLFAAYAGAVADRYRHVEGWTPVNEPVTTARFSALYGAWYPHARDTRSFWLALLGQVDATRLAMRAIRRVTPTARLIQTEDLGQTWAVPHLGYVADYYNARRWLSWDLLAGRVDEAHPLWAEAEQLGLADRLRAIGDDPCPPDVLGLNHYPTSDRYLDDNDSYGSSPASGYHDLEALRVLDGADGGLAPLLRQTWERYGIPVAVTECHLGCTREEQLRWLTQAWQTCLTARDEGVDVRALTIWALFGSVDWNSLLTLDAGHYEPGAFDIRTDGAPRPTAIARAVAALASGATSEHPHDAMARMAGWWERPIRFAHPPVPMGERVAMPAREDASMRPILITGAGGMMGQAFAGACRLRGLTHLSTNHATLPIEDRARVEALLDLYQPWAVVNAAGWSDIDAAESHPDAVGAAATGAGVVARACAKRGIQCLMFSSDQVFDGMRGAAYMEQDRPRPRNAYGRAMLVAEEGALTAGALVVRTGRCFTPYHDRSVTAAIERALTAKRRFGASAERRVTLSYLPDLVGIALDLVIDGERGLWHLTNGGPVSELDFARRVADALGLDAGLVVVDERGSRPSSSALASTRGPLLPKLDDTLTRHAAVRLANRRAVAARSGLLV